MRRSAIARTSLITTYCLRRGRRSRPIALVSLGPGPPPPGAAKVPEWHLEAAQAGIEDAAETLAQRIIKDLVVHAVRPAHADEDAVQAAAFMAAANHVGVIGFRPVRAPLPWGEWYVRDRRPWSGPDEPAVLIRRPYKLDRAPGWYTTVVANRPDFATHVFVGPNGMVWRLDRDFVRSRRPDQGRYAGAYSWVLVPEDPGGVLVDGDFLVARDERQTST
mgnify:CR=1 FL=1